MKISKVISAKSVLDDLSQNKNLPTKAAYKIYVLLSELASTVQFFLDKRRELFLSYGVEDGENYVITPDNQDVFNQKFDELMNLECEKEFHKIDISLELDLGISPADIFCLEPFINFVE